MAQIIKHRRGTLAELNGVTLANGELGIVTGSVTIGDAPIRSAIVVGNTDGTNRLSLARLVQGSGSATLAGKTGGANWNDMIYYDTNDYKLQTLHSTNGVTTLNLTGNISATEIAGNISGSSTSTGSFGKAEVSTIKLGGTEVIATAAEINYLDGVVSNVKEAYDTIGYATDTGIITMTEIDGGTDTIDIGVGTGDSPSFTGVTVSGLTATRLVSTNGASALASSDLVSLT